MSFFTRNKSARVDAATMAQVRRVGQEYQERIAAHDAWMAELEPKMRGWWALYETVQPAAVVAAWKRLDDLNQCMAVANWLVEMGDEVGAADLRRLVQNILDAEKLK